MARHLERENLPYTHQEVNKSLEDTRRNNFIERMREVSRGRPSPMEGKKHQEETVNRIRKKVQEIWNRRHNIEEGADPLTKRVALFRAWLGMTQLLEHSPSYREVDRLKKEDRTPFSTTMYKNAFGGGSFTKAKKELDRLTTLAGPSFEAAQKLTGYLTSRSKELANYGISEEEIQNHNAQIKDACNKILSATSEEETSQGVERLDLRLSRIKRNIASRIPLSIIKGRLRLQSDIP